MLDAGEALAAEDRQLADDLEQPVGEPEEEAGEGDPEHRSAPARASRDPARSKPPGPEQHGHHRRDQRRVTRAARPASAGCGSITSALRRVSSAHWRSGADGRRRSGARRAGRRRVAPGGSSRGEALRPCRRASPRRRGAGRRGRGRSTSKYAPGLGRCPGEGQVTLAGEEHDAVAHLDVGRVVGGEHDGDAAAGQPAEHGEDLRRGGAGRAPTSARRGRSSRGRASSSTAMLARLRWPPDRAPTRTSARSARSRSRSVSSTTRVDLVARRCRPAAGARRRSAASGAAGARGG